MFYLSENKCTSACPPSQFGLNQKCEQCDLSCQECIEISSKCTACGDSKILDNNRCVSECDSGKYIDNKKCIPCKKGCLTCTDLNSCPTC